MTYGTPQALLPPLPGSWPNRYERLAADHDLEARSFPAAVDLVGRLWAEMFPTQGIWGSDGSA